MKPPPPDSSGRPCLLISIRHAGAADVTLVVDIQMRCPAGHRLDQQEELF